MTVQRTARRRARSAPNPETVAQRIGPRIRARRIELGISQRQLASRLGVSASFVSRVETGQCPPSVVTLRAMTSELGISASELLCEPGEGFSRPA
jgi:transcriptional regulator with XRE-family HTH domain